MYKRQEYGDDVYPHNIAFNLLPHIGPFDEEGISEEEWKMVNESRKIMHIPGLRVSGITVRVPIFRCHGESVTAQFERPLSPAEAREILKNAPGVVVRDDPKNAEYPMPIETAGKDDVCVCLLYTSLSPRGMTTRENLPGSTSKTTGR